MAAKPTKLGRYPKFSRSKESWPLILQKYDSKLTKYWLDRYARRTSSATAASIYLPGSLNSFGSTNQMAFSCDDRSNLVNRKFSLMFKSIVSMAFATVLLGSVALGQTSSSSTTVTTERNGVTQTTTTESNGVVTEFTPGHHLFLKTEAAEPVQYKFSKTVTYITTDGKVIEPSRIRRDSKVRVHYAKDGDDMVVDRVIVRDRD